MTSVLRAACRLVSLLLVASIAAGPVYAQGRGGRGRGAGPAQAPPPRIPSSTVGPTLAEATKVLDGAVAYFLSIKVPQSCVVTDSRGDVIALHRMDRARFYLNEIARGKALNVAMSGLTTGGGGVPLVRNNQLVGAIGCSGGTGGQDQAGAIAGAALF
jgi:glc operon protein GlcG